jgi:hypothetical protein
MLSIKAECNQRVPVAGPAYRHVWRECSHAALQYEKARWLIEYVEQTIARERQQQGADLPIEVEVPFVRIRRRLSEYLELSSIIQDQIAQIPE